MQDGNAKRRPNVQGNTETSQRERVAEAIRAIDPKHPHFDMDLKHNQKYILVFLLHFPYTIYYISFNSSEKLRLLLCNR